MIDGDPDDLINQPCKLKLRATGTEEDGYGGVKPETSFVDTVCLLQQRSASEGADQGEASRTDFTAYFLRTETVDTASAVIVDGIAYEFVGTPARPYDPEMGRISHIEAPVRSIGK